MNLLNRVIKRSIQINRNIGNKKTLSFDTMKDTKSNVLSPMEYTNKIVKIDAALPKDKDNSTEIITEKHDPNLNGKQTLFWFTDPQQMYRIWERYISFSTHGCAYFFFKLRGRFYSEKKTIYQNQRNRRPRQLR